MRILFIAIHIPYGKLFSRKKNQSAEENSISDDRVRFYGPPTNCSELAKLGYTLNGYYLTKSSNSQGLLGVVYCRFHQPNLVEKPSINKTNLDCILSLF